MMIALPLRYHDLRIFALLSVNDGIPQEEGYEISFFKYKNHKKNYERKYTESFRGALDLEGAVDLSIVDTPGEPLPSDWEAQCNANPYLLKDPYSLQI
jgi:hypothetical protein